MFVVPSKTEGPAMKFSHLLLTDVRDGFSSIARWLAISAVIMLILVMLFGFSALGSGIDPNQLTLGDYIGSLVGGMAIFHPEANMPFILPIKWLLIVFMMLFVPLNYPYRSMMGFGLHEMIASGGRLRWWLSKCLWLGLYALAFWSCILLVSSIATVVFSSSFDLTVTQEGGNLLLYDTWDYVAHQSALGIAAFLVIAVLVSWALCLIQLALALWVRSVLGYAVNVALLFSSAFFFNAALPGQYLMVARSSLVINSGVPPHWGAYLALAIGLCSALVGGWRFFRMDIIDKEFSS